jgi:hypothetical protein
LIAPSRKSAMPVFAFPPLPWFVFDPSKLSVPSGLEAGL